MRGPSYIPLCGVAGRPAALCCGFYSPKASPAAIPLLSRPGDGSWATPRLLDRAASLCSQSLTSNKMGKMPGSRLSLLALGFVSTCAYVQQPKLRAVRPHKRHFPRTCSHAAANEPQFCVEDAPAQNRAPIVTALAAASLITAGPALAADAAALCDSGLRAPLGADGHRRPLTTERLLLKEDMSEESFDLLVTADIVYGLSRIIDPRLGYFRATAYAKGWEFYAHEPLFWVKMSLLAVVGSASYFPTIKIIQRGAAKRDGGDVPPLSPALIKRMTSIVNAELLGVLSIPFVATLMARGGFYVDGFPWFVGRCRPCDVRASSGAGTRRRAGSKRPAAVPSLLRSLSTRRAGRRHAVRPAASASAARLRAAAQRSRA